MNRLEAYELGQDPNGNSLQRITLRNSYGVEAQVLTWGATLARLKVPDRHGLVGDVILGLEPPAAFFTDHPYLGATIGRYANRIGGARFPLDGNLLRLTANEGGNCLHGGSLGFDKASWRAEPILGHHEARVKMFYGSWHGEEGFPGDLEVEIGYGLSDDNRLTMSYHATTSAPTVVNLTNHGYFNLADGGATPIWGHILQIHADRFTPTDDVAIPTGAIEPVAGTGLDFREPRSLGDARSSLGHGLEGFDHNFIINGQPGALRPAAHVLEPTSGRVLEVLTTQPGLQLYSGASLDSAMTGYGGRRFGPSHGFCLETQNFPDAPNQGHFPSARLGPGEVYEQTTVLQFSTEAA